MQTKEDSFQTAFHLLNAAGIVEISSELEVAENGGYQFFCQCPVPVPNSENLPDHIGLRVVMLATFPYSAVQVFPLDEQIRGFPHQDAETHKLCLPEERRAPVSCARLIVYLQWAIEWLADAANGILLKAEEPYELPHFTNNSDKKHRARARSLWFTEDHASYAKWQNRIPSRGKVILKLPRQPKVILTTQFEYEDEVISVGQFSDFYKKSEKVIEAYWITVPSITYRRHCPPQTFGELRSLLSQSNISLDEELFRAWTEKTEEEYGVLLIGFPIPAKVGSAFTELHWQGLACDHVNVESKSFARKNGIQKRKARWLQILKTGVFADQKRIQWLESANISRQRLYARSGLSSEIQKKRISIVGCGAIGAVIAELFARTGVFDLSLFDTDIFTVENQCRHTLDGNYFGNGKASSLALRLAISNPHSSIVGYGLDVPFPNSEINSDATLALNNAEVIIDCSTDNACFAWLSREAKLKGQRLAHLYINFGASLLTMAISGRNTSCNRTLNLLYADIEKQITPVDREQYFEDNSEHLLLSGVGCWHPTFPARIDHVWMLVSSAFDVLCSEINETPKCSGTAYILERNDVNNPINPLIELKWKNDYR